jgi:hypothetical protein
MAMPSGGGLGVRATCSSAYKDHMHCGNPWLTVDAADYLVIRQMMTNKTRGMTRVLIPVTICTSYLVAARHKLLQRFLTIDMLHLMLLPPDPMPACLG